MAQAEFILEDPTGDLTDKQKLFCHNYIISKFNGTEAAKMTGYSPHTANEQAARLLANVSIYDYITLLKKDLGLRLGITRERVALELAKIAFYDPRKMLTVDGGLKPINELDDETAGAIGGVEIYQEKNPYGGETIGQNKKIKIWDKRAALADLNKMLGYNEPEKRDVTSKGESITQPMNDTQVEKVIAALRENKAK